MTLFSVDIEADGPVCPIYSMLSFGMVALTPELDKTFYIELKPISDNFVQEAMDVNGLNRTDLWLGGVDPAVAMRESARWVRNTSKGRPVFVSDNNGFDFGFMNYYYHKYNTNDPEGANPFGWSSRRIGDLWCGMQNDTFSPWKHLRDTSHTHNALTDCIGNAEVLLKMKAMGLKISTK